MNLNAVKTRKTQKYFKCEKTEHIQRFCRNKTLKVANISDSENKGLLTSEKNQKKKL